MATVFPPDTRLPVAAEPGLSALEREMVAVFADVGQALGLPKSYGEIYGLLYASAEPLSFAEIEVRLGLSKGSVSQGLKALREIGAVRRTEDPPSPGLRRAGGGRNFNTEGAESTEGGGWGPKTTDEGTKGPEDGKLRPESGSRRTAERGRDYYVPETELRQLIGALLREGIAPRLKANAERLKQMPDLLKLATITPMERKLLSGRIEKLQSWRRKASGLLPWITKFLG